MDTIKARIREVFTDHKLGGVEFEVKDTQYLRGISNSDVLPTFALGESMKVVVTIYQHDGEKISNRKGFGWVHTNFQCPLAEKQRARLAEANRKRESIRTQRMSYIAQNPGTQTTPHDDDYKKADRHVTIAYKKLCNKHNAQYGCSNPCPKCLSVSRDGSVAKISGNIFFRNGYGVNSLDFVYFAIIKDNSEGVPMLYVRRRPAKAEFLGMTAEQYQKEYVAKNKHVKNSFCICLYKRPQMPTTYRVPDLSLPALYPAAEVGVV